MEHQRGWPQAPTLEELNMPEPKEALIERLTKEATAEPDPDLPSLMEALEYRRECYGLAVEEFAEIIGVPPPVYIMVGHGLLLTSESKKRAYLIGVPAEVLLVRGTRL